MCIAHGTDIQKICCTSVAHKIVINTPCQSNIAYLRVWEFTVDEILFIIDGPHTGVRVVEGVFTYTVTVTILKPNMYLFKSKSACALVSEVYVQNLWKLILFKLSNQMLLKVETQS